jgi:hypothetical protein
VCYYYQGETKMFKQRLKRFRRRRAGPPPRRATSQESRQTDNPTIAVAFTQDDVTALTGAIRKLDWIADYFDKMSAQQAPGADRQQQQEIAKDVRKWSEQARLALDKVGTGGATLWFGG